MKKKNMARLLVTSVLFVALFLQTNAQFEFLPDFSRNNLLQFLRNLQDVTGARVFGDNGGPTEVQVIVQSPNDVTPSQTFFRRQDNRLDLFQPQPQFQQPRFQVRPQPQPRPQFQQPIAQPQPQFQQPMSQPQPQFQQPIVQPQPKFQQPVAQPQPQFQQPVAQPQPQQPITQPQPKFQQTVAQPQLQSEPQPQFQPQPVTATPRPTPAPQQLTVSTTQLNISDNFVLPDAEFRQRAPQKAPQFLAPGSGRWLLMQDPACLTCICETASGCDETLQCDDRGFCGPFLLSNRYWTLAGKPLLKGDNADREGASADCLRDPLCAAEAVRGYLDRFAQDCDGNRRVDCLDLARIHFQGPFNCKARPFEYMDTFRKCWDRVVKSRNLTS